MQSENTKAEHIKKNQKLIVNISELIAPQSKNGKPRKGIEQNKLLRIKKAFVAIENGKIIDFGRMNDCRSKYKNFQEINANNKVVMPGFVDPHTHLVFAGNRAKEYVARLKGASYLEILSNGGGIIDTVMSVRKASLEELIKNTVNVFRECIRYGTTSFEVKSGYGLNISDEVKMLTAATIAAKECGVNISRTLLAAHAVPPEYKDKKDEYINLINNSITPEVAKMKLAENIDVFCEAGVFSVEEARLILKTGINYGLRPKLHVDEFEAIGGLSLAAELNAISADHLMVSKEKEFDSFEKAGSIGVVLPGTSFGLTHDDSDLGYGRKLIDAGIPVAIGTDLNPGTCMCNSMQMMIEIAILKMGFTLEEAINAATINASFACNLDNKSGMIEIGKNADLLFLSIEEIEEFPYRFGVNKVTRLLLNGIDFNLRIV
ncbi:MAG: imidazolonepropionase [Caldisericia bacterium]|nr:imidazolonepropionase [Caldisericia bacterium]